MSQISLFEIDLEPIVAESGGELRVQNLHGTEVERRHMLDQEDKLSVQGDLIEVVHGTCSDDGKPATLIVMDFYEHWVWRKESLLDSSASGTRFDYKLTNSIQFLTSANKQRFKSATIDLTFRDGNGTVEGEDGPWIEAFSPKGKTAINRTTRHVELKRSASGSVNAGSGPASASAGLAWEKATSQDFRDHATLIGSALFDGNAKWGPKRIVRWTLLENEHQKTGIPSYLRALVRLGRESSDKFTAVVHVKAEVDFWSSIRMGGKKDTDDPIIFDPRPEAKIRKMTWAKERSIDINALEKVKLDEYFVVMDATTRKDD